MNTLLEIKVTSHPRYEHYFYLGLGVMIGSLAMSAATKSLQDSLWEEISFAMIAGGKQLSSFNAVAVRDTQQYQSFHGLLWFHSTPKKKSKKLRMKKMLLDSRSGSAITTELKVWDRAVALSVVLLHNRNTVSMTSWTFSLKAKMGIHFSI